MRSITKFVTLALFCLLNVNCAKNETDEEVSISAASLKFSAAGESKTITISTTSSWSSEHPEWITMSQENGKGDGSKQEITVTAERNNGETRKGDLRITLDGGHSCALSLVQEKNYETTLSGKDMNYRMLFATEDAREDEVMLAILYNYNTLKFGHAFQSKYYEQSIGFTRRFVNHYLMADGTRFTDRPDADRTWYLDEVKDRDPRMAQTVLCPGYVQLDQDKPTINNLDHCYTGYKPIKYIYNQDCLSQGKATNDFPVFRLAEVMLNFAEARAELGNLDQEALDKSVNKIRSRVGMPALKVDVSIDPYMEKCYPNYIRSKSSQKALVLEVRRERTIELVLEGFRMFDMLRWGEGAKLVNGGAADVEGTESPYYGIYLPGPGLYDMDGDGKNDFEVYDGTATVAGLANISIATLSERLHDPDDPDNPAPKKGWLTGFRDHKVTWDEGKDYLNPIPKKQITLTSGALVQNPGWDKE